MRLQVRQTLHSAALEITRAVPSRPWRVRIPSWTTLTPPAKTPPTSVTWRPWGEVTKCSQCNRVVSVSQAQQLTRPTTSTGHPTPVRPTVREVLGPIRCITSQVCWQHVQHLLLYDHLPIRTEVEAHACPVGRRRDQMYTDQRMSRYIITPPSILTIVTQYFASVRLWFGSLCCFNTSYSSFVKEEIILFRFDGCYWPVFSRTAGYARRNYLGPSDLRVIRTKETFWARERQAELQRQMGESGRVGGRNKR